MPLPRSRLLRIVIGVVLGSIYGGITGITEAAGMGVIAVAICGSASLMGDASAALSFAWPLTALVQAIALAMFGVMWWIFRVIARANHP